MFQEIVAKKRYAFHEGFEDWRDAVRAACKPMEEEGAITPEYAQAIIAKVEEFGPYIVIAPHICIPHVQQGDAVNDTAIAFMKTERPVRFDADGEYDARLFFVLAATDQEIHLKNLSEMADALSDQDFVARILEARTAEDLLALEAGAFVQSDGKRRNPVTIHSLGMLPYS